MHTTSTWSRAAATLGLLAAVALTPAAQAAGSAYVVHNLVSDGSVPADHVDPNLVNGWGVAFNPTGFVWLSNNRTGTSTLYNGAGVPQSLVVAVPPAPGGETIGSPTGIVFNPGTDFVITKGNAKGAAKFIFCTEDGTISGWAPAVDGTHALIAASSPDSNYKGLALASNATGNFLYAADFHNGRIDMYDNKFALTASAGGFSDPKLPAAYGPFNIQAFNGLLYVAYAKRDKDRVDEVTGPGLGYVNVFDTDGNLVRRLIAHTGLNAPWGMAVAPADFGKYAGNLLIGNFGDGTVQAYKLSNGKYRGPLKGSDGKPLVIDGLWGMQFGNGFFGQDKNKLYFAAGPLGESGGLYGSVSLAP